MPPRTLIEVASYLCPRPLAAGVSFSPMGCASPDCSWSCSGRRSADVRDTCLAHWPRSATREPGLEGFLAPSRPIPSRLAGTRGDAAKLFCAPGGACCRALGLMFAPWRRRYFRQPQGPSCAPNWRNPEPRNRRNSTGIWPLSQGDSGLGFPIYVPIFQRITVGPERRCRKPFREALWKRKAGIFQRKKRARRPKRISFFMSRFSFELWPSVLAEPAGLAEARSRERCRQDMGRNCPAP